MSVDTKAKVLLKFGSLGDTVNVYEVQKAILDLVYRTMTHLFYANVWVYGGSA